jgi:hypothetical protein
MSMMLELSSRMIDYLPEEVSKIQRTIELSVSESTSEDDMWSRVDATLSTKHLREGAREFWDVFSNASDYAEPLTEGVGGFPIDRSNIVKNRAKDRNVGRVMDVNGQQVLVINKRSNGDFVVVDKMGKRSVKKSDGLGVTKTEKVELNVLDQISEEDLSASESPNGSKKKVGKSTVIINPKASDLVKEEKKDKKSKKAKRWWDDDGDGIGYEKHEVKEDKDPCWKGYQQIGMKDKGGRKVPNCVPKEEYQDLVGQLVSEGYEDEQVREILGAIEEGLEVVFEENGYSIISEETLDEESQFLADVELMADYLQSEGVIENEDQFFELMEDLSEEQIEELYDLVVEATAMAKRGHDETAIRNKIAASTQGGKSADRATALEKQPTYGNANKEKQRQNYARAQRGDHRKTTSSNPGLHGYAHKSNDPAVKSKQAARGAQRGSATLTPNEKKQLNMGDSYMIGNSLEEGGMEVHTYSWREVMESQGARNNPEKYEREQAKKSAPVRGEKTPMPPRGDKRREDFEKWYAANVR